MKDKPDTEGKTMKVYEAPMLVELGTFQKLTGFLAQHGNDRIIFSKN